MSAATALALVPDPIPSPVSIYVEANPGSVLLDTSLRERFLAEIGAEIAAHVPDLTTKKGRDAIKSLAYRVAQTKAPIEAAAKALTEDFRKRTAAVNAERKDVLEKLDVLRARARAPLDEWEAAEKDREDKIKEVLDFLDSARIILASDTSATLRERLAKVEEIHGNIDFVEAKVFALKSLKSGIERLEREEADRAELVELRAMQAERQRLDEERARAEATKAAVAEKAERKRVEGHERAIESLRGMINDACSPFNGIDLIKHILELLDEMQEHGREWQEYRPIYEQTVAEGRVRIASRLAEVIGAEEQRRAAIAQQAAEEAAIAERRKADEAIAAERRRADEAAAEAKRAAEAEIAKLAAEKQALEQAEAARIAEANRIADEEAARQKDRTHRADVMTAAKMALIATGAVEEEQAKAIIKAIVAGKIPNVSIAF